jgi:hypothetical protein
VRTQINARTAPVTCVGGFSPASVGDGAFRERSADEGRPRCSHL